MSMDVCEFWQFFHHSQIFIGLCLFDFVGTALAQPSPMCCDLIIRWLLAVCWLFPAAIDDVMM